MRKYFIPHLFLLGLLFSTLGCGEEASYSLLDDSESFRQTSGVVNTKVDVLWVIDNSGSMETSQQNVTSNLSKFITAFGSKNLDFKMAVTTTDAYRDLFNGSGATGTSLFKCSTFRTGIKNSSCNTVAGKTYSSYPVLDIMTPNLIANFTLNASQTDGANSIYGSGDERPLQSMKAAIQASTNTNFIRSDSFLSVIILTDEEDFSHDGSSSITNPASASLHTTDSYVSFLDTLTGSTPTNRRYNVNAIAIFDEACRTQLNTTFTGRRIAARVGEFVDKVNVAFARPETQGIKSSLCSSTFADDLEDIATNILTLAHRFELKRLPVPSSIEVLVNGVLVPNADTNPSHDGGWAYEADSNSILFLGANYIPPSGANIKVSYDPVAYGQ